MVNGTLWGKAKAENIAQEYLNKTYTQKMIVNDTYYDIESNKYMATAYPKSNKAIKFFLFIDKQGNIWKDQYYLRYFGYELGKEANEYTKKLFGEDSRAYALIDGETIDIYNISTLNENTKLKDVIDKFDRKYYIGLVISGEFRNSVNETKKLYAIIKYTNSLKYKPYKVCFSFYKEKSDTSNFHLSLKEKEYQSIDCTGELLKYINEEIKEQ